MYRNVWSCNRMDEYDDGPYWVILLMYGSHDMRHTGFRRLTVVNGTLGFWGVTGRQMEIKVTRKLWLLMIKINE